LKKDIAFIAVGQAGGNIGSLFEAMKFKVLYINTSMEDLLTLTDAKHIYHITNGEGAAKDRNVAKDLLIADIQELQAEILKKITEQFIFVVFSAGGGYVFNAIHNIQGPTPTENMIAMFKAFNDFNNRS